MKTNRRNFVLGALTFGFGSLVGPKPSFSAETPSRGSQTRKAIMNILRQPLQSDLGGPVEFVVHHLKVENGFAFAIVDPQRPGGGGIRLSETRYRNDGSFMDGLTTYALLGRDGRAWFIINYVTGPTDVVYDGWWNYYNAPRSIFPY